MSTVYNQDQDQVESANDGFENRIGVVVQNNVEEDVDNEGDESDDYGDDEERSDEEVDEGEGEGEGEHEKGQNTLTHLLLGKTNGVIEEDEAEDEEDDEGEGNDDEDDDDDYVDDEEGYVAPPAPITKKRSIDEVAEEDVDPEGSKRVKA